MAQRAVYRVARRVARRRVLPGRHAPWPQLLCVAGRRDTRACGVRCHRREAIRVGARPEASQAHLSARRIPSRVPTPAPASWRPLYVDDRPRPGGCAIGSLVIGADPCESRHSRNRRISEPRRRSAPSRSRPRAAADQCLGRAARDRGDGSGSARDSPGNCAAAKALETEACAHAAHKRYRAGAAHTPATYCPVADRTGTAGENGGNDPRAAGADSSAYPRLVNRQAMPRRPSVSASCVPRASNSLDLCPLTHQHTRMRWPGAR
jgi:hypothetical protein